MASRKIKRQNAAKRRSNAAKKGWRTRRLRFKGIELQREWEGKTRDGSPSGYKYARYALPIIDPGTIKSIIDHVKRKRVRFFVGGQADFRDNQERLFTNNTPVHPDSTSNAHQLIANDLHQLLIGPSNPFQTGRSSKIDVEAMYILVRYKRVIRKPKQKNKRKRNR